MNGNKNPKMEGGQAPKGDEWRWHHSHRQKPSRGRRGWCGGSQDNFPGVEISIAGGVEEMVGTLTTMRASCLYRLFTPTTLTVVSHN